MEEKVRQKEQAMISLQRWLATLTLKTTINLIFFFVKVMWGYRGRGRGGVCISFTSCLRIFTVVFLTVVSGILFARFPTVEYVPTI